MYIYYRRYIYRNFIFWNRYICGRGRKNCREERYLFSCNLILSFIDVLMYHDAVAKPSVVICKFFCTILYLVCAQLIFPKLDVFLKDIFS